MQPELRETLQIQVLGESPRTNFADSQDILQSTLAFRGQTFPGNFPAHAADYMLITIIAQSRKTDPQKRKGSAGKCAPFCSFLLSVGQIVKRFGEM